MSAGLASEGSLRPADSRQGSQALESVASDVPLLPQSSSVESLPGALFSQLLFSKFRAWSHLCCASKRRLVGAGRQQVGLPGAGVCGI